MSLTSSLDDQTTEIIRTAMAAAQKGRIDDACDIARDGLSRGGDDAALSALLGALMCVAGKYAEAIEPLQRAARHRASDPIIRRNLVTALIGEERFDEALALLPDEVVDADPTRRLLNQRAYAAQMAGQLEIAVVDYGNYLATQAQDWEAWNNLGNAQLSRGDLVAALSALRKAADINPRAAPTRLNLARSLRDNGDVEEAEAELRSMARDFANDEKPLVDLYHILRMQGRSEEEAEAALGSAVDRAPHDIKLVLELGDQQVRCLEFAEAELTYRRALDTDPSSAAAYFGLARVLEHHRPGDLDALAHEAEMAGLADHPRLDLIRAFAARRSRKFEDGLRALDRVPIDIERPIRWHLAGQMLESVGDYDDAFQAFSNMNAAQAEDESDPRRRAGVLRIALHEQHERTTAEWKSEWTAGPVTSKRRAPVFLAGFPRSGTTLLDTILMGHPQVAVMEEQSILRHLDREFGGFDGISALSAVDVQRAQQRYFDLAAERVDFSDDTLLVDKSPLYLQRVPQIMRLFPDARFIFALRHPIDVVFSCFKANFRLNNSMANFLALDTAAEFYDLTFRMWQRALEIFAPEVHTVRYESMVENPEAILRPLVENLGLEWHADMLDHQKTAQSRGVITTASYAQVTEPLYRHAAGRWRHYRCHLEPVFPVLAPWVEKFGYQLEEAGPVARP